MTPAPLQRKKRLPTLVIVSVALAGVVVSCSGLVVIASLLSISLFTSPHSNAGNAGNAGNSHVAQSPAISSPTDTSGPTIPQTSAILGGSVFAFDKKFGATNCCF